MMISARWRKGRAGEEVGSRQAAQHCFEVGHRNETELRAAAAIQSAPIMAVTLETGSRRQAVAGSIDMILYYQAHSPFARKALVFAHEAGIADRLGVIHHETNPTRHSAGSYAENPLGKVPVLLRPDAEPIFDSDVICACLDTMHHGRKLVPVDGELRWTALRLQAVAQGLAQAGIGLRWEIERRPVHLRYEALADGYRDKIEATYDWLEDAVDARAGACRAYRRGDGIVVDGVSRAAAVSHEAATEL